MAYTFFFVLVRAISNTAFKENATFREGGITTPIKSRKKKLNIETINKSIQYRKASSEI